MGTILSTILISAPLAFLAGWLLCKTLFSHIQATRSKATSAVTDNIAAAGKTDMPQQTTVPAQAAKLINALKKRLAVSEANSKAARNENQLLKEAVAEREQRLVELRQQLAVAAAAPEESHAGAEAIQNLKYAKEKRGLEQRIKAHEHEIAQLRRELVSAENRLDGAGRRFSLWRTRVKPLTKRIRKQRMIMRELREELRQRERLETEQRSINETARNKSLANENNNAAAEAAPQAEAQHDAVATPPPVEVPEVQDNLQKLRGIGPALQRKLQEQGIFRMQQLAELDSEELLKLGKTIGVSHKLMVKNDWSKQARELLGLPEQIMEQDAAAEAMPA